ncbi:phosphatidic acid phosphatase type 2/haloperoxidase [Geopyxis carbonaria]|nr:phosphatidic acid phosphatase type 2/haloperoxidase [Geopyxis carbonaria]
MPLFGRNRAADGATNGHSAKSHPSRDSPFTQPHINRRLTFGAWFRSIWLDILTMACLGAVGLGVYMAPPAPTRSFPVFFQDGEIVYPEFAYPLRKNIIPIWLAALLAALVPIFIVLCMQIRVRSFLDANAAIVGLLYSLINAAVFQVFLKWLIGGLRPHFLAVCKPNLALMGPNIGTGLKQVMYTRAICTGDEKEINDSLESFPSGHSTAAFAGFVFLSLYLNAKLKIWADHHPAMWKLTAVWAPVLGATLIAGSLTIDEFHNWYDCVAGAIIGTAFAFSSYRAVYASVWDFRFNHIPLPRGKVELGFRYGADDDGFWSAVATRKAGWGWAPHGAGVSGAPFDAAMTGSGVGAGVGTHGHVRGDRMV